MYHRDLSAAEHGDDLVTLVVPSEVAAAVKARVDNIRAIESPPMNSAGAKGSEVLAAVGVDTEKCAGSSGVHRTAEAAVRLGRGRQVRAIVQGRVLCKKTAPLLCASKRNVDHAALVV
jgi:hypothetical protein